MAARGATNQPPPSPQRLCACGATFTPTRSQQRVCRPSCRGLARKPGTSKYRDVRPGLDALFGVNDKDCRPE